MAHGNGACVRWCGVSTGTSLVPRAPGRRCLSPSATPHIIAGPQRAQRGTPPWCLVSGVCCARSRFHRTHQMRLPRLGWAERRHTAAGATSMASLSSPPRCPPPPPHHAPMGQRRETPVPRGAQTCAPPFGAPGRTACPSPPTRPPLHSASDGAWAWACAFPSGAVHWSPGAQNPPRHVLERQYTVGGGGVPPPGSPETSPETCGCALQRKG